MTEVARLLADSLTVHNSAKPAGKGQRRDMTQALEKWGTARALRLSAHALDPEHADPAWANERVAHEAMMLFYDQKLGPVTE